MRFRQAKFPRSARVLDACLWRSACAAIVTGNQHHVGVRFGDTSGDCANANFGDEFDADPRITIGVF